MTPQDSLMKPNIDVGIVGYGAYIPRYRLPATEISKMWTGGVSGVPIAEKAVNGLDEDVVTMSIEAARNALDYPNISDFNDGFYREDAKLYIIAVTDEADQSDGTPMQYVDFFRNLKGVGNPDLLNISAISGPPHWSLGNWK